MIKCYLVKESNELVAAGIGKDLCSTLVDSLRQKEEEKPISTLRVARLFLWLMRWGRNIKIKG